MSEPYVPLDFSIGMDVAVACDHLRDALRLIEPHVNSGKRMPRQDHELLLRHTQLLIDRGQQIVRQGRILRDAVQASVKADQRATDRAAREWIRELPRGGKRQSSDARHFCRTEGCDFMVEPKRYAHTKVRRHRLLEHNLTTPARCHTECGYRARPHEGRYTEAQEMPR